MTVNIELNEKELEQLIETFFAGTFVLEEHYPNPVPTMELSSKINKLALEFGRKDLVFVESSLAEHGIYSVSKKTEEKVMSILFSEE